ncbi:MAG: hypothetical protein DRJ43_04235, partial [Thermoprotei archaeon]
MVREEELNYVFQALAHETRRRIIRLLAEEGPMQFTELMKRLGIEETGTFGFHIKRLEELLEKVEDGGYRLSELGRLAYSVMRYAEEKGEGLGEEVEAALPDIKVFKGLQKMLVTRSMLEEHGKVAFEQIGTVAFAEDIDGELFEDKVLYFKFVGRIVVPKSIGKLVYRKLDEWCGDIIGYEGGLPAWLDTAYAADKGVRELENYGGTLMLTRERLERARREGYVLRIENYGMLVIEREVTPELFEEAVHSIESYGPIYAPRELHKVISD